MEPKDLSTSPADAAHAVFCKLRANKVLPSRSAPDMTEADTRAKLIDPMLRQVLGWNEPDIRREASIKDGFVDYVIGAQHAYFHIEAKRRTPRFALHVSGNTRLLKLSGPHLLENKKIREVLEQAAGYALELGSDFTVVTNGDQYIVFPTRIPGKRWRDGRALVWHSFDDIQQDFANFFSVLCRDRVTAGGLTETFQEANSVTRQLYSPIQYIHHADADFVRNQYWDQMSKIVGPLLTDQPGDLALQEEIIRNCYVSTPISDQSDAILNELLKDEPTPLLRRKQTIDLQSSDSQGKTAFDFAIENDVKLSQRKSYVVTGGVGSGKTTFLRRFARVLAEDFVQRWCVWLHVDYLAPEAELPERLQEFTYKRLRERLSIDYRELVPKTGEEMRRLFPEVVKNASMTLLHGLEPTSPEWNSKLNEEIHRAQADDVTFVRAILASAVRRSKRVVVVLDNTDQLGEGVQAQLFFLAQRLAEDCQAITIIALREEKFFAAYRRSIFDAYGDRSFHVGSPYLADVIKKRLMFAVRRYRAMRLAEGDGSVSPVEVLLRSFIRSTTQGNQSIVQFMQCVSNGDMRHALKLFREFVSSGNTNVEKILSILKQTRHYTVPFHEFVKSAILGSRRYFRASASHFVSIFGMAAAASASHLTGCRLLARLSAAQGGTSKHGASYVDTSQILHEYRSSFGTAQDLVVRGEELLRQGLIESEPPRAMSIEETSALRISASGSYYWRYLVGSFAYLDLVLIDTPILDRELAERLANWADEIDLSQRFERVRAFLDYLESQEADELARAGIKGPYATALLPEIRSRVESEITRIRDKTGAPDLSHGDADDAELDAWVSAAGEPTKVVAVSASKHRQQSATSGKSRRAPSRKAAVKRPVTRKA